MVAELLAEQKFASTQGVLSKGIAFLQHLAAGRRADRAIASTCSALMRVVLLVFEIDQAPTSPASTNVARTVGLMWQYIQFRDGFPAALSTGKYQLEHGMLELPRRSCLASIRDELYKMHKFELQRLAHCFQKKATWPAGILKHLLPVRKQPNFKLLC